MSEKCPEVRPGFYFILDEDGGRYISKTLLVIAEKREQEAVRQRDALLEECFAVMEQVLLFVDADLFEKTLADLRARGEKLK